MLPDHDRSNETLSSTSSNAASRAPGGHTRGALTTLLGRLRGDVLRREIHQCEPLRPTAQGEAIGFEITAYLTWNGRNISRRLLRKRIERYQPFVLHRLRGRIRPIARKYAPHQAADVEKDVREQVGKGWTCRDRRVWCDIEIYVEVDGKVRSRLAAALDGSIDLITHEAYSRRKADSARELTLLWTNSLDELGKDFRVPHAAHAADNPDEFAATAKGLVDEHFKRSADLRELLEKSVDRYRELGLYEFATAYDSALTGLMRYLGVDKKTADSSVNGAIQNGRDRS